MQGPEGKSLNLFLLVQEKSYYALRLPHGWWLFGLDLALVDDIDMCQCRYAAMTDCATERLLMQATFQPACILSTSDH